MCWVTAPVLTYNLWPVKGHLSPGGRLRVGLRGISWLRDSFINLRPLTSVCQQLRGISTLSVTACVRGQNHSLAQGINPHAASHQWLAWRSVPELTQMFPCPRLNCTLINVTTVDGYAVNQEVERVVHKPEGRLFDPRGPRGLFRHGTNGVW